MFHRWSKKPEWHLSFAVVVLSLSHVWLFVTVYGLLHTRLLCHSTVLWSLLKFMCIESVMLSNHLILCHPLLLPSILPSISLFQWVGCSHQVAKYRSFIFSSSPSNEYSELASFRIDWSDLLAVQGILKSSSSTIIGKHQFFGTQPSWWSNSHKHTWLLEKP